MTGTHQIESKGRWQKPRDQGGLCMGLTQCYSRATARSGDIQAFQITQLGRRYVIGASGGKDIHLHSSELAKITSLLQPHSSMESLWLSMGAN